MVRRERFDGLIEDEGMGETIANQERQRGLGKTRPASGGFWALGTRVRGPPWEAAASTSKLELVYL